MNTGYSSHRTRALFYHQSGLILSTLTMYHEETKELFSQYGSFPVTLLQADMKSAFLVGYCILASLRNGQ